VSDDGWHVKDRTWRLRDGELYQADEIGEQANCSSTGTLAMIAATFSTDNVIVSYDFMVDDGREGAVSGFAFRIASFYDFYRFEWSDQGWMAIVHYTTEAKTRDATVLGALLDVPFEREQWYHVELDINAGVIGVHVKSENHKKLRSVSHQLLVTDPEYRSSLVFDAAFYGSGTIYQSFDNVVIVAHADRKQLSDWAGENWPQPCVSLPDDVCFFENFERKYVDDIDHEIEIDGDAKDLVSVKWQLPHDDSGRDSDERNHVCRGKACVRVCSPNVRRARVFSVCSAS
jgi:hypothetical protein